MNPVRSFYQDGLRFECQGSGKCCLARGEYGYVYVTDKDRQRLADHLGLTLEVVDDAVARLLHRRGIGRGRAGADPARK